MGTVFVNDVEIECGPQDNLILAARKAGVEIPHYCWHPDLSVVASCRMCLVEVGEKKPDGTVVMQPRLIPGCQTLAKPGTVIRTDSDKVKASQAQTLEYLLLNHPLDCSICDQAGECYLQDYTFKFGNAHSRLQEPKVQREDKYHIGEQIALFTDRCVMCTRCVRFTREISGTSELHVISRGSVEEIEVFPDQPCNNKLAGNVVDLCPVGALCSKDFLYKKRVWWLKSQDSVCNLCSTGCSVHVDQNENKLYRLRPRENDQAQGSFMCDEGRFGWKYIHRDARLLAPRLGRLSHAPASANEHAHAANGNGNGHAPTALSAALPVDMPTDLATLDPWPAALEATRTAIVQAMGKDGHKFVAIFSPMMTIEEAYMLAKFLRSGSVKPTLALGPVPVIGEDDRYPKNHRGEAPALEATKFTIAAEKCPNRRGVEMVLKHFQGELISFDKVLERVERGDVTGAYVVGGYTYPETGYDQQAMTALSKLPTLIVQDLLRSPLTEAATILLASSSFAEREGTFINQAGLAQLIRAAIRPLGECRADGRLLFELAGRKGVFNSAAIRREMATEIFSLSALGSGELGPLGTFITKQPQPATV
ncbi:MAG: (2Fe-2S)-binding protein [Pirellulaceae bacterium]|nr:(2Fe-2S)-binding protein [Pirellulaceae bacterium]